MIPQPQYVQEKCYKCGNPISLWEEWFMLDGNKICRDCIQEELPAQTETATH